MVATYSNPSAQQLNPVQMMLLKMFNRDMSEQETKEIKALLLYYLDVKLQKQLDKDIKNKNITQADLDNILNESQRTPQ
jgi:hypothetical protein